MIVIQLKELKILNVNKQHVFFFYIFNIYGLPFSRRRRMLVVEEEMLVVHQNKELYNLKKLNMKN